MIYVAAGGVGSRIRPKLVEAGFDNKPKHLLDVFPVNDERSESLVRLNTLSSLRSGGPVTVLTNCENSLQIQKELDDLECIVDDGTHNSPIGPFSFTQLEQPGSTSFSIAGDVYIEGLDWGRFKSFHETGNKPVTFLVGRAAAKKSGAVFEVNPDDNSVENFYRSEASDTVVTRNVGVYGFTLTEPVVEILEHYARSETESHDQVASDLISGGYVQAMFHEPVFYNINGIGDYLELLQHTSKLTERLPS